MRFATVALAVLLLAAPAAAGKPQPPHPLRGVHAVTLAPTPKRTALRSCAAQRARIARKLAPVACEQPPRSQLASSLEHASAAIAALLGN